MIDKLTVYISNNNNPYENLAYEKLLFDNVKNNECILYLWQNENTVVIGRNQNPWTECNLSLMKDDNVFLARRLSGGGSVYHDLGNLNFTFIMKEENYNLEKQLNVIKRACSLLGINVEISGRNDILADGKKFSGNAFYNSKGTSYHHGTILINADKEKMQKYLTPNELKLKSKGVKSVKSRVINLCEINNDITAKNMKKNMISAFEEVYENKSSELHTISSDEILKISKAFSDWDYLYGKSAPFTFSCNEYFPWGTFELNFNIQNGTIIDVEIFTDSMDWTVADGFKEIFKNCRFEKSELIKALSNSNVSRAEDIIKMIEKQKI